jgi:hypothetical protein
VGDTQAAVWQEVMSHRQIYLHVISVAILEAILEAIFGTFVDTFEGPSHLMIRLPNLA